MLVEVCANSLESAMNAQNAGADRIELCLELAVGGITPSYGFLKSVKKHLTIPVHVLIRPRSGDFSYSTDEFKIMIENIALCVKMGFDGIVSGVLNKDFTVDAERTKELIDLSGNLKFTFHRAFDWVANPEIAFDQLAAMGVDYILSSGQQKTAIEGIDLLSKLNQRASACSVIPGGGVNAQNAGMFKNQGFKQLHLSATKFKQQLKAHQNISMNTPSFLSDDGVFISNTANIENVLKEVK